MRRHLVNRVAPSFDGAAVESAGAIAVAIALAYARAAPRIDPNERDEIAPALKHHALEIVVQPKRGTPSNVSNASRWQRKKVSGV